MITLYKSSSSSSRTANRLNTNRQRPSIFVLECWSKTAILQFGSVTLQQSRPKCYSFTEKYRKIDNGFYSTCAPRK